MPGATLTVSSSGSPACGRHATRGGTPSRQRGTTSRGRGRSAPYQRARTSEPRLLAAEVTDGLTDESKPLPAGLVHGRFPLLSSPDEPRDLPVVLNDQGS